METFKEYSDRMKNENDNPYQQLRQSGVDLGMRGASKLNNVVDMIVNMAANKDNMLKKIITYLKAAAKGEPNEQEMISQLNNAFYTLANAAQQVQTQQPQQPMNTNIQ